jgi:hypothetical protein
MKTDDRYHKGNEIRSIAMTQIKYLKKCVIQANQMMKTLGVAIHWDENFIPETPEKVNEEISREPHDGWLNSWFYQNVPKDKNCLYLWNSEARKMAGDWADFRMKSQKSLDKEIRT